MNKKEHSTDDQFACLIGSLNLSSLTGAKIILWLVAITVVSFAIGFGILAVTGDLSPQAGHRGSPFLANAMASPNTTAFALDGSTAGAVRITMGAGELTVHGGAPAGTLMESRIFSTAPEWQPEYLQSMDGAVMTVAMTDPGHTGKEWFSVDSPNVWEVALAGDAPISLEVKLGAGDCTLMLGTLNLTGLSLNTGAGETMVDLIGYRGEVFSGTIHQGVGDLTVRVPQESNTRIVIHQGIGDLDTRGLIPTGNAYTTPTFNPAGANTEIFIHQGVGDILVEAI